MHQSSDFAIDIAVLFYEIINNKNNQIQNLYQKNETKQQVNKLQEQIQQENQKKKVSIETSESKE